uniref:Nuclear receptor n=1 Tax=Meloidogyne javanica TaxID=6303 RepID=A0A915MF23_MELJA
MEPKNNFQLRKNTLPIKCCICGCIASGFIYYNVKCCDGCKHFFRRCVNAKELFRCKFDGNCDVMTIIEQRLGELALKGKYCVKNRNENYNNTEETNFSFMQQVLNEIEETKIIENLLLLEKNVRRIRNSPTQITDKHYDFSYKTLDEIFNRKENSIFLSHEYLDEEQSFPKPDYFEFIHKNGPFALRPISLIEDLMLIIDVAKTMPFFYKLELNDIIYQLTNIAMPLAALTGVYYSYKKWSRAVISADGVPIVAVFGGEYYKGDITLNNLLQKLFITNMEPFYRVQLDDEEYLLLRSIMYSHFVTNGVSKEGQKILLSEAEKYSKILMKMLQNRYGPLPGARRYTELLHLIEFCFKDRGRFEKVMPEPLIDLCLQCKNMKLPDLTEYF